MLNQIHVAFQKSIRRYISRIGYKCWNLQAKFSMQTRAGASRASMHQELVDHQPQDLQVLLQPITYRALAHVTLAPQETALAPESDILSFNNAAVHFDLLEAFANDIKDASGVIDTATISHGTN